MPRQQESHQTASTLNNIPLDNTIHNNSSNCPRWVGRMVAYLCDVGEGKLYSINAAAGVTPLSPESISGDGSRRVHCYLELRNSSISFSKPSSNTSVASPAKSKCELWYGCEHGQCLPADVACSVAPNLLTDYESRTRVLCPHAQTMLEASLSSAAGAVVTAPAVDKLLDGSAVSMLGNLGLVEEVGIKELSDLVLQASNEVDHLLLAVSPRVFSVFCSTSHALQSCPRNGWAGRFGRVHVYIHTWKKGPSKDRSANNQFLEDETKQEEDRVSTVKCECTCHQSSGRCVHATLVLWFLLSIKQDAIIRSVLRYRMLFANNTHGQSGTQSNSLAAEMEHLGLVGRDNQNSSDLLGKNWVSRMSGF